MPRKSQDNRLPRLPGARGSRADLSSGVMIFHLHSDSGAYTVRIGAHGQSTRVYFAMPHRLHAQTVMPIALVGQVDQTLRLGPKKYVRQTESAHIANGQRDQVLGPICIAAKFLAFV